jgi:hypothetical protein
VFIEDADWNLISNCWIKQQKKAREIERKWVCCTAASRIHTRFFLQKREKTFLDEKKNLKMNLSCSG